MVDSVKIQVEVEGRQAKESIDKITKSVKDFGSIADKSFGSAVSAFDVFKGSLAADVVAGAFRKIGSAITSSISTIVNEARRFEDLSAQINTFTGSLEKSQEVLRQVQKFGATTPFEFPELAETTKTLLSFGVSTEDITKRLNDLGNASAATGANINELALIFGQVSAAGKLTGERLLQLQERGINIGPQLAKNLGVAESSIRDLVSKGKISVEDFQKALSDLSKEGGQFFGAIDKLSNTASGQISNFNDSVTVLATQIGTLFLPVIRDAAGAMANFIAGITPGVVEAFRSALITLLQSTRAVIEVFNQFSKFLVDNKRVIEDLGIAVGIAAGAWITYKAALIAVAIATKAAALATTAFGIALKAIGIGLVIAAIALLVEGVRRLIENWDTVKAAMLRFTSAIIQFAIPAIEKLLVLLANLVGLFNKDLAQSIRNGITSLKDFSREMELEAEVATRRAELIKQTDQEIVDSAIKKAENIGDANNKLAELEIEINQKRIRSEKETQDQIALIREEAKTKQIEEKEFDLIAFDEETQLRIQKLTDRFGQEAVVREIFRKDELAKEKKQNTEKAKLRSADAKNAKDNIFGIKSFEEQTNRERLQNFRQTLAGIASASNSSNKTLFAISKAAGIAQATIDTFAAANKALASAPPPVSFALAAATIAVGLSRVASIAGTKFQPKGNFQDGGVVPGTSFSGDNVPINVNSGEMILNRQQQGQLFNDIKNGTGVGSGVQEAINNLASAIAGQNIVVSLNERELARGVRDASRAGFITGVS